MKLSIQPKLIGKDESEQSGKWKGYQWQNRDLSIEELFELIAVSGYAHSCELKSQHRHSNEFKSRQLFCLDIDGGRTVQDVQKDEFYQLYSCGLWASPSYKPQHHKFRVMFVTENPITTVDEACAMFRGLMTIYQFADVNCKDAVRFFFGCQNSPVAELHPEKFIPTDVTQMVIDLGNVEPEVQETETTVSYETTELSHSQRSDLINLLCGLGVIGYDDWRHIGWGLKAAGFSCDDFCTITTSTIGNQGKRPASEARRLWKQGDNRKGEKGKPISIGSVFRVLDQAGVDYKSVIWPPTKPKEYEKVFGQKYFRTETYFGKQKYL